MLPSRSVFQVPLLVRVAVPRQSATALAESPIGELGMRPVHTQTAVASPKQTLLRLWTGMGEDGERADTKRRTGVRDATWWLETRTAPVCFWGHCFTFAATAAAGMRRPFDMQINRLSPSLRR